jgi:DNA-binding CsgD family transcriptional regulator
MATVCRGSTAHQDLRCSCCGQRQSDGGCQDPKKCLDTISRIEGECTREFVNAFDDPLSKASIPLLLAGLDGLDTLGIGLAVCSSSGHLLLANWTAGEIVEAHDGLELNSDNVLCTTQECGQTFVEVVRRAVGVAPGDRAINGAALTVRRPSGKRALTLLVRSVRRMPATEESPQAAALVLILDSALSVKTTETELGQLYGLTFAEARLANLLMDGKTLNNCACELGICRSTARDHLRSLFKKTRVHRQSQLVSLLLRSIGLARLR